MPDIKRFKLLFEISTFFPTISEQSFAMEPSKSACDTSQPPSEGTNGYPENTHLPESTTVLIVGGGPVGLFSALTCARYGLDSVVLERHATRLGQPKAHVVNQRTLEIFRQCGLDLTSLRELGLPPSEAEQVIFASSMTGVEYGVLETGASSAKAMQASPEMTFNVAQPLLEEHLLQAALKTGLVTFLRMHEWQHCSEDPTTKEILSTVLLRDTNQIRQMTSKYLIACDGTHAKSRAILQIPFQPLHNGPETTLHYVSIHFSADLSHLKPALLYFILNPPISTGVLIAYNRKSSWVFAIQYDPTTTPATTFSPAYLRDRVAHAVGAPVDSYVPLGTTLWTTSPKLAGTYRSAVTPNAFLAGDAAHSFPPTGGLGMNTGIGDVQNLVWKIYAVERGWVEGVGGEKGAVRLLDSVTWERRAVAGVNARQSRVNEEKMYGLVRTIFGGGGGSGSGEEDGGGEAAADAAVRKEDEVKVAIEQQRAHFDSLNMVLGHVYGKGEDALGGRGPSDYRKECVPGGRLPHGWVVDEEGKQVSSLDLVEGFEFVLLAAEGFTEERRLLVGDKVPVAVVQAGRDFVDRDGEVTRVLGLKEGRAVLVRPDQHVVGKVTCIAQVEGLLTQYFAS